MSNAPHLFADRLVNVAVNGSLIRLELGVMQPPAVEGQKPQLVTTQTLVMPLEGFLPSFGMMETFPKRLVADGVINLQSQAGTAPATEAAPTLKQ